jgi:hypothetical protein
MRFASDIGSGLVDKKDFRKEKTKLKIYGI